MLFQSDVELLIGRRPFEEKKVHIADEEPEHPSQVKTAEEIAAELGNGDTTTPEEKVELNPGA